MKSNTNSRRRLAKTFRSYAENIFDLINLPVSIWYPDKLRQKIVMAASAGLPPEYQKRVSISLLEPSVTGDVFKQKKTEVIVNITKERRWKYKDDAKFLMLKSALCIPIISDEQSVGVLTVYTTDTKKAGFSVFRNYLESVAAQIGLAIEAEDRQIALEKLLDISKSIISLPISRKINEILDNIAREAIAILDADLVDLYHYNVDEDKFTLPPCQAGERQSPAPHLIHKDDVAYMLIHKGKPLYVKNSLCEDLFTSTFLQDRPVTLTKQRFVVREKIVSTAAIPLFVLNQVVGLLFVNYRTPQTFSQHQRELIELFANQAAIAISNLHLFEKAHVRAEALKMLNVVAEKLVKLSEGSANLNQLLEEIADGAKEVLGADLVDLYQYQQSLDNYPLPVIQVGIRNKIVKKDQIYQDDVVRLVVNKRRSLYVEDAVNSPILLTKYDQRPDKPDARFVVRENIKSMAAIPMKAGDEIVGVLFTSYRTKQIFSDRQRDMIEFFAAQAAIAIRNARLLIRRQALVEFGRDIASKVEWNETDLLVLIHQKVTDIMDTSNMYIALYDTTPDVVRFGLAYVKGQEVDVLHDKSWQPRKAGIGPDGEILTEVLSEGGIGKTEEIIRTKRHIFHSTYTDAENWYNQPGHKKYVGFISSSWMGVPMAIGDKVIGVVATYQDRENVYSDDDLVTMQTIANQAAVALNNARSYVKINKNLGAMLKFGETIASHEHLRVPEILELIREQVRDLMNVDSMYVALYEKSTQTISFGLYYNRGQQRVDIRPRKVDMKERGLTEEIIQTKKSILISTLKDFKNWYYQPGHKEFVGEESCSWLGVPVLLGQEASGVIAVFHSEKEYIYTSNDEFILQAIANQAAIVLDNAHQYFDIEQNLRALVEFSQQITSKIYLTRKEVLQNIYEKANTFLDASNMYVAFCEKDNEKRDIVHFELVYRNGELATWPDRDAKIGRTGQIINTKQPLFLATREEIIKWVDENPGETDNAEGASWLGVPMLSGSKVIGVIGVSHPEQEKHYTHEDLKILQALANFAAIAFENSRLYNDAREEAVAERQLSTLGRALAAIEHRINNTLNIIVPNLHRLRRRMDGDDAETNEIMDIIERNARYTSLLLDRIHTPLLEVSYVELNINSVLREVFDQQKQEWVADRTHWLVQASLVTDPNIFNVRLPIGQITEVFQNLVQNAYRELGKAHQIWKVKKDNGQLTEGEEFNGAVLQVSSTIEDGKIKVRVKDNVPGGIPAKIKSRIFSKPVPSQKPEEGSGLGLWLSKMIMTSVGGDIRIESTDSYGTTMLVEIPLAEREKS